MRNKKSSGYGPRYIQQQLQLRGIPDEVAQQAVRAVDDWNQVLLFSLISYPFAYKIIAPEIGINTFEIFYEGLIYIISCILVSIL